MKMHRVELTREELDELIEMSGERADEIRDARDEWMSDTKEIEESIIDEAFYRALKYKLLGVQNEL